MVFLSQCIWRFSTFFWIRATMGIFDNLTVSQHFSRSKTLWYLQSVEPGEVRKMTASHTQTQNALALSRIVFFWHNITKNPCRQNAVIGGIWPKRRSRPGNQWERSFTVQALTLWFLWIYVPIKCRGRSFQCFSFWIGRVIHIIETSLSDVKEKKLRQAVQGPFKACQG